MKKHLLFFGLAFALQMPGLFAQDHTGCGLVHDANEIENEVRAASCARTSSTFTTKYGKFQQYIPNAATPVKTIKIAFHFWQKNDGTGNWENIPAHITRLDQVVQWMNGNHANIHSPSDPIASVPFISDSRIQYEAQYYFYQNTTMWNELSATVLSAAVAAIDPTRLEALPIHVTNAVHGSGASVMRACLRLRFHRTVMCGPIITKPTRWATGPGSCTWITNSTIRSTCCIRMPAVARLLP